MGTTRLLQLNFAVDFSPMTNHVNHDDLLLAQDLVQDAIVTDTEFEESRKLARQGFRLDHIHIRSQPIHSRYDSATDWFIETLQLVRGGV